MSPIRLPKLSQLTSTIEGIRDRFSRKGRVSGKHTKQRRLLLDPLEQRQLLSLSPGDWDDTLINDAVSIEIAPEFQHLESLPGYPKGWQPLTSDGHTYVPAPGGSTYPKYITRKGDPESVPTQSTAVDNDGDFVVTWQRQDLIQEFYVDQYNNPGYRYVTDPTTGSYVTDTNIYARYFTDEVQRITLPSSLQDYGTFRLVTSDRVQQKLTFSSGTRPFSTGESDISARVWLVLDESQVGVLTPEEYGQVSYRSDRSIEENLNNIKDVLKDIPGLKGLTIQAINSREFLIEYDASTTGYQALLEVNPPIVGGLLGEVQFEGFLPAVTISTVSRPVVSSDILVSPTDPYLTAMSIETAFGQTSTYWTAPSEFPPPERVAGTGNTWSGPYTQPLRATTNPPKISVKPVFGLGNEGLVFDVTFVGTSGKKDQPEMIVVTATGDPVADATVTTLKETSAEFRVNPWEVDSQFTSLPDVYDQTAPAVAMDSDGDFVITWTSEVSNSANYGSVTDIFARRFSPIGLKTLNSSGEVVDVDSANTRGVVTDGIRSWIDDVQILTFDTSISGSLSGKFKLSLDGEKTEEINFNSNDLLQVARDIQDRLVKIGYEGVQVKSLSSSDPYKFQVTFSGRSGGYRQSDLQYVEVDNLGLGASGFSSVHREGTGTVSPALAAELSTFQVNTLTTNPQDQAAIGMDDAGNFVITWAATGQDLSFFNGIYGQRFDRFGGRVNSEFQVIREDTAAHRNPYVALSNSGNIVVAWSTSADPNLVVGSVSGWSVLAKVYNAQGTVLRDQFGAGGGGGASVAFDANDNWVITYTYLANRDGLGGLAYNDVFASMYDLDGTLLRPEFRVNSASTDTSRTTLWPLSQYGGQAMVDADGDLLIAYAGFGPDTSYNANADYAGTFRSYLSTQINGSLNNDLRPYVDDLWSLVSHFESQQPGRRGVTYYDGLYSLYSNGDVDGVLEQILIHASNPMAGEIWLNQDIWQYEPIIAATPEQLGRLRAVLEGGLGLLRGEANGVMYSNWDAAPGWNGTPTTLFSDNIINAQRDGHNARYIVSLEGGYDWVSFVLRVSRPGVNGTIDVPITCARTNNVFDPDRTIRVINNALEGVERLGNAWPETNYEGVVDVRRIYSDEIVRRQGTAWDLSNVGVGIDSTDFVYEITFQGAAHDTSVSLGVGEPVAGVVTANEIQRLRIVQDSGATQPFTGNFNLTLPLSGATNPPSRDFYFDSSNPGATAGVIQSWLRNIGTPASYPRATVEYIQTPGTTTSWEFLITFNVTTDLPQLVYDDVLIPNPNGSPILSLPTQGSYVVTENQGGDAVGPRPNVGSWSAQTAGDPGIEQTNVGAGMETDGDFTTTWQQYDWMRYGEPAVNNLYYRRFDESTDTAGPLVTDVMATTDSRPGAIDEGVTIYVGANGLKYVVLSFDEDMMTIGADSVTNPLNYRLLRNGVTLSGAIVKVEYGLNKAAELARSYRLNATPSNKFEAVLTIDGNGFEAGAPSLSTGDYTVVALAPVAPTVANPNGQSGLRDRAGNPLGSSGFMPTGQNFARHFFVRASSQGDDPGTDPGDPGDPGNPGNYQGINGHTYPETPSAIAVDGDGDQIAVWTAYDAASGYDRVYVAIYEANGQLASISQPLFSVTDGALSHDQRFASVACDKDGDFVVTWTEYDAQGDSNIRARRFAANGTPMGGDFQVNTYTVNQQKWSNVAMDVDGDFVVTWSSNSQEDNNQLGSGYGVYARRFDSFGQALSGEFRVNQATVGDQRFSNVAMGADGRFAITWTSQRSSSGEDILARAYDAFGVAMGNEVVVNATTAGNQIYSDISSNLAGTSYVITWSSAGQDGDGWGVYSRLFNQSLLATSGEILANTTTNGDQQYPSVAMADNGTFVVTWSGRGEQATQDDDRGVFYRRFAPTDTNANGSFEDAEIIRGLETRVNNTVVGTQYLSSIGSDAEGNFVVFWTGTGTTPDSTEVYKYVSMASSPAKDLVGPIVTDVLQANGQRLLDGDLVVPPPAGMTTLKVVFDENLSTRDLTTGQNSVLNPANWTLERNGTEIIGAIKGVIFAKNPITRKYEATLTLDGNGLSNGQPGLNLGNYVLTVRDRIWDAADNLDTNTGNLVGNSLDGDFDGTPGTAPSGTGYPGFKFRFSVVSETALDTEFRINQATEPEQRFSDALGTGDGREETTRSIAVDHDGDFVVVWTSYRQNSPHDPADVRIYYRVYNRDGVPLTDELSVTTTASGQQRNAAVASDADGDFVIVWEEDDASGNTEIFARRFSATGADLGAAFRVNDNTGGDQLSPTVAMDNDGSFVVVWATRAHELSTFNDLYAQRYNPVGEKVDSEFLISRVNTGSQGFITNPAVALSNTGQFIVTWDQVDQQSNGTSVYAQVLNFTAGAAVLGQPVLIGVAGTVRNPQVAVSDNPLQTEFIVTWEGRNVAGDYDVYYQRYTVNGATLVTGATNQANAGQFGGAQVNPSVSMDADGDFVIVWNGNGAQPDPLNPALSANPDAEGVFLREFFGTTSVQSRVNQTVAGIQQFPSVGMTRNGDYIVVWSGRGVGDQHGIFGRRYDKPVDTTGPMVTELRDSAGQLIIEPLINGQVQQVVLTFDEDMRAFDDATLAAALAARNAAVDAGLPIPPDVARILDSVTNPENYQVLLNGAEIAGAISHIDYQFNAATNKFEAVLALDGNGFGAGVVPFSSGTVTIRALAPQPNSQQSGLRDVAGNPLGLSNYAPTGSDFARQFTLVVSSTGSDTPVGSGGDYPGVNERTYAESPGAVAVDADGDQIVVWTAYDPLMQKDRVYFRIYNADGTPAAAAQAVTPAADFGDFVGVDQRYATVACDLDGDFVITWTQFDEVDGQTNVVEANIYARRFRADLKRFDIEGNVVTGSAAGSGVTFGDNPFQVNTYSQNHQKWSDVAMDPDGDFIVVWSSYSQADGGQLGTGYDVYARRFTAFGTPVGNEFLATVTTGGHQMFPSVAMDRDAGFVIAWASDQTPRPGAGAGQTGTGSGMDIIARSFWPDGTPQDLGISPNNGLGFGEVLVNQTTDGNQTCPDVAMSLNGDSYVVTWTGEDSNGQGVFARQFSRLTNRFPVEAARRQLSGYVPTEGVAIGNRLEYTFNVDHSFTIQDLDVQLDIQHPRVSDLQVYLTSPAGTVVMLSNQNPRDANGTPYTEWTIRPANTSLANFSGTIFDDEAAANREITEFPDTRPPYSGRIIPEQPLNRFNVENTKGTWRLTIVDRDATPFDEDINNINNILRPSVGILDRVVLDVLPAPTTAGPEVRVNTTQQGEQFASSIAVDDLGNVVVVWSGRGEQLDQEDTSGHGVYFQRYDNFLLPLGGETRINGTTTGNQWVPSVDMDSSGNFVVAWMGQDPITGDNTVYKERSQKWIAIEDLAGPVATELQTAAGERILDGGVVTPEAGATQTLRVVFSEDLSVRDGNGGLDSVLNPANWMLVRNGQTVLGGIVNVEFLSPAQTGTRKYEALVTLDGDALANGLQSLAEGNYSLVIRDQINDAYTWDPVHQADAYFLGNALDGDVNGFPGTTRAVVNPGVEQSATGYDGAVFHFAVVADAAKNGAEFRINEDNSPATVQRFGEGTGTGLGLEESSRTVVVDNDGDFVVVWTAYGPNGRGDVYFRLFDRENRALTGDKLVTANSTAGNQRNPSVAMDADGDFIIVWEEVEENGDGNIIASDVYARRFDARGNAVVSDTNHNGVLDGEDHANEFVVNTETRGTQFNPAVAMDDFGYTIIVWASAAGQPYSYFHNVQGQLYDVQGRAVGNEFRVNEADLPGASLNPGSMELNPTVAMAADASFTVAWERIDRQLNGIPDQTDIMARMFMRDGTPNPLRPDEFQASMRDEPTAVDPTHLNPVVAAGVPTAGDSYLYRRARNPQLAYNTNGEFILVWEAYQDNDIEESSGPESYGIYFVRYDADGTPEMAAPHQANLVITSTLDPAASDPRRNTDKFAFSQVNPSIAMDADGDYAIVWNGNGANPNPVTPDRQDVTNWDREGIWIRSFHTTDQANVPEFVTPQSRVNMTAEGIQQFPTIAMEPDGDSIVVWSGVGVGDRSGIFARRYNEATDTAGPMATELRLMNGKLVYDGEQTSGAVRQVRVVFDEAMTLDGQYGVRNVANWTVVDGEGRVLQNRVDRVDFELNQDTNKWEAKLTFRGTGLQSGAYEIIVSENVEDLAGNKLRHTGFLPGSRSDDSDDLVRRTSFRLTVGGTPSTGMEFLVNQSPQYEQALSQAFETGSGEEYSRRTVAVDHDGDFAVVWTSYGQGDPDDPTAGDVYLRLFNRENKPLTDEILVNSTVPGNQWRPSVAMDADGDLVVVWQSDTQDSDGSAAIFARRFNSVGTALGGEFRVNSNTPNAQENPSVAMDDSGNFVVVWATQGQFGSYFNDICGQRFDSEGSRIGSEFRVNSQNLAGTGVAIPSGFEFHPVVAMNGTGQFLVAWEQVSAQQAGVVTDTIIAARLFNPDGTPVAVEFRADQNQGQGGQGVGEARTARNPQVAINDEGTYMVAYEYYRGLVNAGGGYTVRVQETSATGVAQPGWGWTGLPSTYNYYGDSNFVNPSVALDADGDSGLVVNGNWAVVDPLNPTDPRLVTDQDSEGVFLSFASAGGSLVESGTRVNRTERGIQQFPTIAMEPDGDAIIVWQGVGAGDEHGIFARRYNEATDTAGPMVTDFLYENGTSIRPNAQVTQGLDKISVVFDEDMWNSGADSVENAANYHLMKNGVELVGAITGVEFGLNKAYELGLGPKTNKFEAVLELDGNGATPGDAQLGDGQYEIVIGNNLRDAVGNPLNSTGTAANGGQFRRSFNIADLGSGVGETLVNSGTTGDQNVRESAQPVASDADGNYVAVWMDGTRNIYAKLYQSKVTKEADSTRDVEFDPTKEVFVDVLEVEGMPKDKDVANAAVAMDGDGDFVVTWSQNDGTAEIPNWNVWARRFNANGTPITRLDGSIELPFRVNTYTDNIQRNPTVAMDNDGDFLIAWQSFGQDGSGYGIYAQRYSPAGNPLGGTNEVQMLEFVNSPKGTFHLSWDHDNNTATEAVEIAVTHNGNTTATAKAIKDALEAELGLNASNTYFDVYAASPTEIAIRFINAAGSQEQAPISLSQIDLAATPNGRIEIRTAVDGSAGEFRVNDTAMHSQMYASAAMNAEGDIVVSWTGYGQDGDAASESNVYAKVLPGNSVISGNTARPNYETLTQLKSTLPGAVEPWLMASDTPDARLVAPGSGVCLVDAGAWFGSGSLLWTGRHVLTAAHVVTDDLFGTPLPGDMIQVQFDTADGIVTVPGRRVYTHPTYAGTLLGSYMEGDDIAIIELEYAAPASIPRYDIYRRQDEVGKIFSIYGYGTTGTGTLGITAVDQQLRWGQNRFDATADLMGFSEAMLMYDFDSGYAYDDTLGWLYGINDLGMGHFEASGAQGDSGGPSFIDGKIATVHSAGMSMGLVPWGFGTVGFDTRVSVHAEWIDQIVAGTSEFLVSSLSTLADGTTSTTTVGNQKWSSVAMDADGDFVVTWTSYGQDGVGNGYGAGVNGKNGVYARRFGGIGGGALGAEFQVNSSAADNQQYSHVDMDADGDFVVVWESFQDQPQGTPGNSYDVYAQRYVRSELLGQQAWYGPNGELGGQFRVNSTTDGDQRYPGVALNDTGDYVVVWSGNGLGDDQGIFLQRFAKSVDDAGPTVTGVYSMGSGAAHMMLEGVVMNKEVTTLLVNVGEKLSEVGGMNGRGSVFNPQNWQLTKDGAVLNGAISTIDYVYNSETKKYEIKLGLDGDVTKSGLQALGQGLYVLTLQDQVEDLFGNRLDGDLDGKAGGDFNLTFSVYTGLSGPGGPGGPGTPSTEDEDNRVNLAYQGQQDSPAMATNATGDYVIVWTTYTAVQGGATTEANIVAQRFNRYGQKTGSEFIVNTYMAGNQAEPDVAMDDFGNFVVVWSGMGEQDTTGIYARRFDAFGQALDAKEICVNVFRESTQVMPSVSMDADGDFVVTWTSAGRTPDMDGGVYARRFNFLGLPQDNASEFLVNTYTKSSQRSSDVAMDAAGNFTIVWMSDGQDGNSWGVVGQRYNAAGQKLGSEFLINQYTADKQLDPHVAMDSDGDFVVAWSSFNQDQSGYGVYARRYSKLGSAQGNEFRVNQNTTGYQYQPDVSMADDGNFVVTWTTYAQEGGINGVPNNTAGVFARRYNASGAALDSEWRVNATIAGDQVNSVVAMDADGDFAVAWIGPDNSGTGIYQRVVGVNPGSYQPTFTPYIPGLRGYDFADGIVYRSGSLDLTGTSGNDLLEFIAAPNRSSWVVKLNGVVQTVTADLASVRFDGLGGQDTVWITGTADSESVELWPDRLVFTGTDYTVSAQNVELVVINGQGGNDTAVLHDSAGKDTFTASQTSVTFVGPGFSQTLSNFETLKAYSEAGGEDVASLEDSAGDDRFVGTSLYGELTGPGYSFYAGNFLHTYAYARKGGQDTVELYDSTGNDTFQTRPDYTVLTDQSTYYLRVKFFDAITAFSTAGGIDTAIFYDSTGNDVFTATPTSAQMVTGGVTNSAKQFDKVYAKASSGIDVAKLYDSAGDDHLVATPTVATFTVQGSYYEAAKFDMVQAYATEGGLDSVQLYDSAGNDTFEAGPRWGKLSDANKTFQNITAGFDNVLGYATAGGVDTATLYDSAGDELFVGREKESRVYGVDFYLRAKAFDNVLAYAREGGNDVAQLYGTAGNNAFKCDGITSYLSTPTVNFRTKQFDRVEAFAGVGDGDTAELSNVTLQSGSDPLPAGTTANYVAWLSQFEQIQVKNKAAQGGDSVVDAKDKVFAALWE